MKNFVKLFQGLIKELNDNDKIDVVYSNLGPKTPTDIFDMIVSTFELPVLPNEIYTFFKDVSIMELEWECDLKKNNIELFDYDDEKLEGSIKLFSIENMLMSNDKLKYLIPDFEEDEKEDLTNFRYFDDSDDVIRVGIIIDKDKVQDNLVYLQEGVNGFIDFPWKFEDFISKMISCKGFVGWTFNILYPETDSAKRMNYYLDKIF